MPGGRDAHLEEARLNVGAADRRWNDLERLGPCDTERARAGATFHRQLLGDQGLYAGEETPIVVLLQIPAEGASCGSAARSNFTLRQAVTLEQFRAGFTLESPPGDPVRVRVTVTPRA